ncbi:MAG TPA: rod shape-determining protein MreD [Streptosporangiaceae bacterium]|jgi:rod shape-determining protein MreD|nr:rod shape-determining protein MreD [Streptosporangiaceae bacterium]
MRRAPVSALTLLVAILIQLTVLNSLPLPGGSPPDLVLVTVAALALTGGPVEGMLDGFLAGLALDVAPPATHLIGLYALIFCLVGYAAGRIGADIDHSALIPLSVVAACSAGGELLYGAVGIMFGVPDITWASMRQVLPAVIIYDLLISPFVLYAVVRVRAMAAAGARSGEAASPLVAAAVAASASARFANSSGAVRESGLGRAPRLRMGSSRRGDGWIGGAAALLSGAQPRRGGPAQVRFRAGMHGGSAAGGVQPARRGPGRAAQVRFRTGMPGGSASGGRPARRMVSRPVRLRFGTRKRGDAVVASRAMVPGGGMTAGSGLRSARGPRMRGSIMAGGSASGTVRRTSMPARPVNLKLGGARFGRRGDGVVGGSVRGGSGLGRSGLGGSSLGRSGKGATMRGSAFNGGSLRSGQARKTHRPRFRGKQGALRRGAGSRGGLGGGGAGGALGGGRGPGGRLSGRRLGGSRFGGGIGGGSGLAGGGRRRGGILRRLSSGLRKRGKGTGRLS